MILGDGQIRKYIMTHNMVEPYKPDHIQPNSIDVCLGAEFLFMEPTAKVISMDSPVEYTKRVATETKHVILHPGQFCLGTTLEYVRIPRELCCEITGRSSIGRLGLAVHVAAGHIDSGFYGRITLHLCNHSPNKIKLVPGRRIAQLLFLKTKGATFDYPGKYAGQTTATESRIEKDEELCQNLF